MLLCRSQSVSTKPLFIIDPITLDESKDAVLSDKANSINMEWKDDKENNRFMGVTPLFTDNNYIYTLSYKKPEKGKKFSLIDVQMMKKRRKKKRSSKISSNSSNSSNNSSNK